VIHEGERAFSCSQCNKRFGQKKHLQNHERTHTGEKPFACNQCSRCFAQKYQLVRHGATHMGDELVTKEGNKKICGASEFKSYLESGCISIIKSDDKRDRKIHMN